MHILHTRRSMMPTDYGMPSPGTSLRVPGGREATHGDSKNRTRAWGDMAVLPISRTESAKFPRSLVEKDEARLPLEEAAVRSITVLVLGMLLVATGCRKAETEPAA